MNKTRPLLKQKNRSPAFQFYPSDWLSDIKLQSCSLSAQGLLINIMCLMHQSDEYGKLLINGRIPLVKEVSKLLRLHHKTYQARLIELFLSGALYKDENGAITCKRMVKDEYIRELRRKSGKLGGNPLLNYMVKQEVKQKQTPSSSSSSSSSRDKKASAKKAGNGIRPIPKDFTITDPMREWFKAQGFKNIKIDDATAEFIDYWLSAGRLKKDWIAAWRNSMRKTNEWRKDKHTSEEAWKNF